MRKLMMLVFVLFVAAAFAGEGNDDKKWFDMNDCEICKTMAAHKDVMAKMKWEVHKIHNGSLSISVVPVELKPVMEKAHQHSEAVIKRLEGGETMELCGYCTGLGELFTSGAKKTDLDTVGGKIMMVTSDDPTTVKAIHAHVDKTKAATKELMAAMSAPAPKGEPVAK